MSEPDSFLDTNIQPGKPPLPDGGIQANPPAVAVPSSLAQTAFRARMRRLLEMHNELKLNKPNPPMWGYVQFAGFGFGIALGWTAHKELTAAHFNKDLAGVAFLVFIIFGAILPDLLLRMGRRLQYNATRDKLVDFIEKTLRNYPSEVDQCGGVAVLADRVELEALLHVLQEKFPAPEEPSLPPL